ncbi:hypothetical protein [Haloferax sp. YSMS24]|uniref:hypothetical protein n=1 Tax=Haloferax sp. YSMS24 TaxID=3388425 RepID=UPI00398D2DCC
MQRRAFLAVTGTGLAAALAGCTASANGDTGGDDDSTPDPTPEPTPEPVDAVAVESGEQLTVVVGDGLESDEVGVKPHRVRLTNPESAPWTVRVEVSTALRTGHLETYEIHPDAEISVPLSLPADYEVTVTDVETDATTTELVTPTDFDCNQSWTTLSPDDGSISVSGAATRMACSSPAVTADEPLSVSIGDGSLPDEQTKPRTLSISNPTESAEEVDISLETDTGAVAFGSVFRVESGARIDVNLTERRTFVARVGRIESEASEAVTVEPSSFDCNNVTTVVALNDSGGLQATTLSTLMACGEEQSER